MLNFVVSQIVAASVSSANFSVSALVNLRLTLLGPPRPVTLISFTAFLTQRFELWSKNGSSVQTTPRNIPLVEVDSATISPSPSELDKTSPSLSSRSNLVPPSSPNPKPPCHIPLAAGTLFTHSRLCRIPSDKFVRPTTLPGTETPLRVSHTCSVKIRFRVEGEKEDRVISIARDVVVASWCVLSLSLTVLFLP
jgi:hypothetical protein